jgi:hypothetical protein
MVCDGLSRKSAKGPDQVRYVLREQHLSLILATYYTALLTLCTLPL